MTISICMPVSISKFKLLDFEGAPNTAVFGMLHANQLEHSIPYGYEYHGPNTRLIVTPMTERCLLNLTSAIRLRYTGLVYGGTQTGKTESIQEISKVCSLIFHRSAYLVDLDVID